MLQSAEGRRRPLRTYGRQTPSSAPADTVEQPPAKRCRVSDERDDSRFVPHEKMTTKRLATKSPATVPTPSTTTTASSVRQPTQQTLSLEKRPALPATPPATSSPAAAAPTAKKSTITSYFRVVPHLNSKSSSCADHLPSSDGVETQTGANSSTNSPPSSPPPPPLSFQQSESRIRRKPRRLTTKAKPRAQGHAGDDDDDDAETDGRADVVVQNGIQKDASKRKRGSVLSSTTPSALNRDPAVAASISSPMSTTATTSTKQSNANPKKRNKSDTAMVQQTLSLSMTEKGFTECRECSMLYNPLHEKDRRFHARQHAAILKAREAKENEDDQ
ncbi:uncharacterized protein B0I36DRAFT_128214 [Microdochium trichocladiopsis]|uniref:N-acetyltransferase ESCO zinc-finger domain-containing protein n=1 Tax=Microdochium trichocladiopsis TaxID=1682393 RepID=A0A9P8Y3U6_9PEZI|nr:uncharacterized protein B0I36DRAFT_128214 [Microdochium trichocladiopsis]KAH7029087.1 hypothetical protein B0I36DRAFT_128214 [Microdochium trichocladiopsis]